MSERDAMKAEMKRMILKTSPVSIAAMMVQEPDFDPEVIRRQARANIEMFVRGERKKHCGRAEK